MKITQRLASLVAGGVLVTGMALAVAPAATAAPAAHTHPTPAAVQVVKPSIHATQLTLVAKGAAVRVTLSVTAPKAVVENVNVQVTQVVKGKVTGAYVYGVRVTGTGKALTVKVLATVNPGLKALKVGRALVQGGMDYYGNNGNDYVFTPMTAKTMRITK